MYSLIREFGIEIALRREAGPFLAAFILASLFYKFGNFALECGAFLISWYVISAVQSAIVRRLYVRSNSTSRPPEP